MPQPTRYNKYRLKETSDVFIYLGTAMLVRDSKIKGTVGTEVFIFSEITTGFSVTQGDRTRFLICERQDFNELFDEVTLGELSEAAQERAKKEQDNAQS